MEAVHKFESTLAEWFKNTPHLPKGGREWLATNAWWLVLIVALLGALSVMSLLWVTFIGAAVIAGFAGVAGAAIGGLAVAAATVSLLLTSVWVVLAALAIKPLKESSKKGWDLLFMALLLEAVTVIVIFLLNLDLGGLIFSSIGVIIGAYVLFELRPYFSNQKTSTTRA